MADIATIRRRAFSAIIPPPRLPLSAWIETNIVLPSASTAVAGKMRLYKPQREVADVLGDPSYERVSILKSARVGYTVLATSAVAYWADQDPGPILILQPRETDAKDFMATDLEGIVRESPALAGLWSAGSLVGQRGRAGRNTQLMRTFPGGSIRCVAAKSPANLRRFTIRYLVADEVDAFDTQSNEGAALPLAERRTLSYDDRRIIAGSTPGVLETSAICPAFEAGDKRVYHVRCVECQGLTPIEWKDICWEPDRPETAHFVCPLCGCCIGEDRKAEMVETGEWIAQQPNVVGHASFKWTSLISPLRNASWATLAKEFLQAKNDPATLQPFLATVLAEPWRQQGDDLDETGLASRVEDFGLAKIPEGVMVITCGADIQDSRIELTYVGWSKDTTAYILGHSVFFGPTVDETVWLDLADALKQKWAHPLGGQIGIDAAAIDAGDGGMFDKVLKFCSGMAARRVWAIKGVPGFSRAAFAQSGKLKNRPGQSLFLVGVDAVKSLLFQRLKRGNSIRFSNTLEPDWFDQLCSERLITRFSRGRPERRFERIPGKRAEALDCVVYAYAARQGLALNLDAREAALRLQPQSSAPPRVTHSKWLAGL